MYYTNKKGNSYFMPFFTQINRFVDVEFNQLDITINQQTWVVLLDFLGIGNSLPRGGPKTPQPKADGQQEQASPEVKAQQPEEISKTTMCNVWQS